jgi:streptogramin lyase
VSAPLVAGIEAHANPVTKTAAAEAFYKKPSMLSDVITGIGNGVCIPPEEDEYLCSPEVGYDGPTGWGTPSGVFNLNPASWAVQSTPNPTGATLSKLNGGVSCIRPTTCTAVGEYKNTSGAIVTLAERWNGKEWSVQPTPNPTGAKASRLRGVSCGPVLQEALESCEAVGEYENSSGVTATLAERWISWNGGPSGEWYIERSPNPTGAKLSRLSGVSCRSVMGPVCLAVGEYENSSGTTVPLAEYHNGFSEWALREAVVPTGAKKTVLNSVYCGSSTGVCHTVGYYQNSAGTFVTLAERLYPGEPPGTPILETTSNPTGATASYLKSLSCPNTECVAVGEYVNSSGSTVTLAERLNSTPRKTGEWSIQTTPNPTGATASYLRGVSCPSGCTAVGEYKNSSGTLVTLGEVWNGKEWSIQTTPNPTGAKQSALNGIFCVSSEVCTTTGAYENSSGRFVTLAEVSDAVLENVVLPVASPETPDVAVPETTTTGGWTNEPTSYAYQWQRCNATGGECVNISGATSSTYTPVEADVEHTLVVKVTATNSNGSATAYSKATNKVKPIGQITEYALPAGSGPDGVASGPDGNVWFADLEGSKIGKITLLGTITEYALPAGSNPYKVVTGPDNNLWFTDWGTSKIGRITASGTITEYALPAASKPYGIVTGPDGNLWFTDYETGKIGKITTSGTITEYALPGGSHPLGIASGPDSLLWFAVAGTNKIGKITTSGTITEYALPSGSHPYGITRGPDGNLWFTDNLTTKIGKITTSGTITEYALPAGSEPAGIASGADGSLWFADAGTSKLGRITTSGTITEYALPAGSHPYGIASGPDSNVWFTDYRTNKIGTITP